MFVPNWSWSRSRWEGSFYSGCTYAFLLPFCLPQFFFHIPQWAKNGKSAILHPWYYKDRRAEWSAFADTTCYKISRSIRFDLWGQKCCLLQIVLFSLNLFHCDCPYFYFQSDAINLRLLICCLFTIHGLSCQFHHYNFAKKSFYIVQ